MEHKHEPIVSLDNILKCRTCGQSLSYSEREIGKVVSSKIANRMLDELAIKGSFKVASFESGFIVYFKEKDGIREELTVKKQSERQFVIIQRYIMKL